MWELFRFGNICTTSIYISQTNSTERLSDFQTGDAQPNTTFIILTEIRFKHTPTSSLNYLPHAPRGGWQHGILVQAHSPHVNDMKAINILVRRNSVADLSLINVL